MRLSSSSTVNWVCSDCGFNVFGSVEVPTGARSSGLRSIVFCCPALFEIAVCRCPGIQRFKVSGRICSQIQISDLGFGRASGNLCNLVA
jgi:hypothetical protein